jgi:ABC-2 type transport system permease protein
MQEVKKIVLIALNNINLMRRDKTGLLMFLLMPIVLVAILGSALGGMFGEGKMDGFKAIAVNRDKGSASLPMMGPSVRLGSILVDDVFQDSQVKRLIDVETASSRRHAETAVGKGKALSYVYIPSTFSKRALSGDRPVIDIYSDASHPTQTAILNQIVQSFADEVSYTSLAPNYLGLGALTEKKQTWMPEIREVSAGVKPVSGIQYYSAAMVVMFAMMSAISKAGDIIDERRIGTYARMLTSPTRQSTILAGQVVGSLLLIIVQMIVLMIGTRVLFGVQWGNWASALLLAGTFSLAASGIGTALSLQLNDRRAADGLVGTIGVLFSALSGGMFPIYIFPSFMKMIAKFIPNYWALQGFLDQMSGLGVTEVVTPVVVLSFIGICGILIGLLGAGRRSALR